MPQESHRLVWLVQRHSGAARLAIVRRTASELMLPDRIPGQPGPPTTATRYRPTRHTREGRPVWMEAG